MADLPITPDGQRDKYIGLALAISSSLAIGTSFIITKKARALSSLSSLGTWLTRQCAQGLIDAADRHDGFASDSRSYLKNWIWWAGMVTSKSWGGTCSGWGRAGRREDRVTGT